METQGRKQPPFDDLALARFNTEEVSKDRAMSAIKESLGANSNDSFNALR